jgi:hypothetical protein
LVDAEVVFGVVENQALRGLRVNGSGDSVVHGAEHRLKSVPH